MMVALTNFNNHLFGTHHKRNKKKNEANGSNSNKKEKKKGTNICNYAVYFVDANHNLRYSMCFNLVVVMRNLI